ncbi:MAG: hypothetical protein IPH76_09840 [Xanthomonadales bacterium]|nr:hypothetical protein [Xanthomonadales bacterium]
MSTSFLRPASLALALTAAFGVDAAQYRYDGQLDDFGQPANGRYDVELSLFSDEKAGRGLSSALTFPGVEVRDGRFQLEFDAPLADAAEGWVQIAVRATGDAIYSRIPGRSKAISAPLIGACWSSTGDSGSSAATNFLGTTDAQPLVLKTHNTRHLRIDPSSLLSGATPITANILAGSSGNIIWGGVRGATIAGGGVISAADPDFSSSDGNQVSDVYGSVGGGASNIAGNSAGSAIDAPFATVAGGSWNAAKGAYAAVSGGLGSNAVGLFSVVAGGYANCAGGDGSFVAGSRAKVRPGTAEPFGACSGVPTGGAGGDTGTFIWADSQIADFVSTGTDQFLVRADGGAAFNRNAMWSGNDDFVIGARSSGGDADVDLRLITRSNRNALIYVSDTSGTLNLVPDAVAAGSDRLMVSGGVGGAATLSNGGTWTNASSRTYKEGFAAIDAADVLERVLALGITRWSYIGSGEGEHVGPMAEDFHAAFGLGRSEKQIATVDADGVALAAIQGLNAKLEAENAAKDARIDALSHEVAALRALIEARLRAEH